MLDSKILDLNIDVYCDGLVNGVWQDRLKKGYKSRTYQEILKDVG
jgi:hypothetical protein